MRRRCSIGVACLFGLVAAYFVWALGACALEDIVDLGADLDAAVAIPDAGHPIPVESGAIRDAGIADRMDSSMPMDAMDESEPSPLPDAACPDLKNGSFEAHLPGDAQATQPLQRSPPGWVVCGGVTASTSSCKLRPTDGDSYVGLSLGLLPWVPPASIDGIICALQVGATYSLSGDVGLDMPLTDSGSVAQPPSLQIWGGTAMCSKDELLNTISTPSACIWSRFCVNILPSGPDNHLVFDPATGSDSPFGDPTIYVIVDNLKLAVGACPPEL